MAVRTTGEKAPASAPNETQRFAPGEVAAENELQTLMAQLMEARLSQDQDLVRQLQEKIEALRQKHVIQAGIAKQTQMTAAEAAATQAAAAKKP